MQYQQAWMWIMLQYPHSSSAPLNSPAAEAEAAEQCHEAPNKPLSLLDENQRNKSYGLF